jgi:peptide-methionine (S)-S-oxide reductase
VLLDKRGKAKTVGDMRLALLLLMATVSPLSGSAQDAAPSTQLATFGGGCFWCVEAVYERVPGVISVTSGYAGGNLDNPTYEQVVEGDTGHAEVVQVEFDPARISFRRIIDLFWDAHDPTTLNRQGADVGPQYRSIILFHDDAQRAEAEASRAEAQPRFRSPIVTEIVPLRRFYAAEAYHQDFQRRNPRHGYVRAVIDPKLARLEDKGLIEGP